MFNMHLFHSRGGNYKKLSKQNNFGNKNFPGEKRVKFPDGLESFWIARRVSG